MRKRWQIITTISNKPPFSFFVCVFIALFLAIFYNTVTNMAGVYIVSDLGGSSEISIYAMVFFGLGNVLSIPLTIPLAKRWGYVKLLVYGLVLYTIFSILCGQASTFVWFNLYRLGLGFASGLFYILCRSLIFEFIPQKSVPLYTFIMISFYAIVPVFGACFGGWVAYESHWRWIFHVNEGVALILCGYFWIYFKELNPEKTEPAPFDKVGYVFFVLAMGSLLLAATLGQQLDWYRSSLWLTLLVSGVLSFLFFIGWEWNHPEPLLELKLLKNFQFSYCLINLSLLFASYFGMIILIPLWLNIYVNYTPLWIAALVGIMAIAGLLGFFISRTLLPKFDPRLILAVAILFFISSCYYSTYFNVETDFYHLAVARFLSGLGLVLFLFPLFKLALGSHPLEKVTSVFTLFQIVRASFGSLGAALYVILWQRRQEFFHERLGEGITLYSSLTAEYFQKAIKVFHLTNAQAIEQLQLYLQAQATSLALNDVFAWMGYLCLILLGFLFVSFIIKPIEKSYTLPH